MAGTAEISRENARDKLIVALDVDSVRSALAIVDQLGEAVTFYKVGLHLQLDRELHSLLERLIKSQKRIFLDFKAFDIPETVSGTVKAASNLGVDFITVVGQRAIVRAAVNARSDRLKILVVTLLTGMDQSDLHNEYRTEMPISEFVTRRAQFAAESGCDGVISSAREVDIIRQAVNSRDFLIVTPGIRPSGISNDDQKRVATPYDAIKKGADYLVIGRPIIRADNPLAAVRTVIEEMARGIEATRCVYA